MKKKPIITGMLIVLLLTSAACERVKAMDTSYEIQTVGTPDRNEAGEIIGDCHYQKLVQDKRIYRTSVQYVLCKWVWQGLSRLLGRSPGGKTWRIGRLPV